MRTSLAAIVGLLLAAQAAGAQPADPQALDRLLGATVAAVRVVSLGVEVRDPQVASLIEMRAGEPLTPVAVRRTIVHLMGLGTYLDVRVHGEAADGGVRVVVELVPLREVGRLVFSGDTGLPDRVLRDAVTLRFGTQPPLGRATDVARTVEEVYADYGYLRAAVQPRALDAPGAEPGDLVFDVVPGTRAVIRAVEFRGAPADAVARVRSELGLRPGLPYQPLELRKRLSAHVDAFRAQGFLEARADPFVRIDEAGGGVDLTVAVTRGPLVTVQFAGDPLPEKERDVLVPVAREGSADEDLLEDSQFRIERFLRGQGYRDARAPFTREESDGHLRIVFTVTRGALYRVAGIALSSNAAVSSGNLSTASLKPGDPFVQARLEADAGAVLDGLRRRGPPPPAGTPLGTVGGGTPGSPDVPVTVAFQIEEGPRAVVSRVSFEGVRALPDAVVRAGMNTRAGDPYYRPLVEEDRERILVAYRDGGFREAGVDGVVTLSTDGTNADVHFSVREGRQTLVDHILIVGNTRTSEATIRRELTLRPGDPLGDAAVSESQRRLAALGLFRRSTISELPHTNDDRRDVLVTVEEAPATSIGYGGGLEFQRVETSEVAPRGFFEVGRRNLWGKNRSVNLFSRVSLRRYDQTPAGAGSETDLEYRVIGSYREPRVLTSRGDLLVAAVFEQGSRTSFRFRHRSARMDFIDRRDGGWNYIGQFTVERNEIFDDRINPVDKPLIDRLFPQVLLSSVAGTMARDTRNDPIEPVRGTLLSVSGEFALRQLGSEIGYAKTFLQAFAYRQLPAQPRLVLAGGIRVGLGTGFPRNVSVTNPDGTTGVERVRDLPASKRFFAGGDTTVRGFRLDHLGTAAVFDRDGIPKGGHAELLVNAEGRLALWKDLGIVGFVDVGNVYARVNDIGLGQLRSGAGFGVRYKSPIGPLRVDLGFKLGTLRTYGSVREGRREWHISLGQAF